ncbi:tetratricopeptide repeat protein [Mariniflexile sp. AS56]|uniref:tetratricopeptide repeat protein n=1 Tax=Mariniflexile sp. AS56 TaxID=3063957 RepID=UPI0026EAC92B|nr:tetratricopeptide repeat protein [Mariniflexile sp. AS56]MDO7171915.1 tetratricopeptide repeat protein [Mariniflexile sp. AS56]
MKRIIIILIVTICQFTTYAQARKFLRQATKTNDLNEKIELYTQVIELEPKNLDAYFYRGLAKNDLGDYSGAIVDYSKIIVIQPDADTYYNRGNSRYSIKNYVGAKDDYENAYKLDPNFIDALYSLACVKYDLGDFEGAISNLSGVINVDPSVTKTYYLRASAYAALENHKLALNDYSLAILSDQSSDSFYNRGVFYLSINYYQDANTDFSIAIKRNRNNSFAHFYRGTSFLLLGKYEDALLDFNTALGFDPLDFDALTGLALTYYNMNNLNSAKLHFQKAKAIIAPEATIDSIDQFKNTYWYQNQYFYFSENFKKLVNLQ